MNQYEWVIQNHIILKRQCLFQVSGPFSRFMLLGSRCRSKGWSYSLRFIDSFGSRMPSPEFPHPHVHFIQLAAISRSPLPVSATMTHSGLQIWQSDVGLLDSHCLPCNKASVAPGIRRGKGTQRAWWAQVQEVDQAHTVEWCHQGDAFHLQDQVEPFQERKRR